MSNSPSERNPFASPHSISDDSRCVANSQRRHTTAVTAVAVLNYAMGAFNFVCGGLFAVLGMHAVLIWLSIAEPNHDVWVEVRIVDGVIERDPDPREAIARIFGGVIIPLVVLMILGSLLTILAGYGVQKRRQWGRILAIVLASLSGILALLHLVNLSPFAWIYGGYSIYALLTLFQRQYADEFY